jgi:hypothetical protein
MPQSIPEKIIVEIPMAIYLRLVGRFKPQSTEYHLLKNGIVVAERDELFVQILCEREAAALLKDAIRPSFLEKVRFRADEAKKTSATEEKAK